MKNSYKRCIFSIFLGLSAIIQGAAMPETEIKFINETAWPIKITILEPGNLTQESIISRTAYSIEEEKPLLSFEFGSNPIKLISLPKSGVYMITTQILPSGAPVSEAESLSNGTHIIIAPTTKGSIAIKKIDPEIYLLSKAYKIMAKNAAKESWNKSDEEEWQRFFDQASFDPAMGPLIALYRINYNAQPTDLKKGFLNTVLKAFKAIKHHASLDRSAIDGYLHELKEKYGSDITDDLKKFMDYETKPFKELSSTSPKENSDDDEWIFVG